MEARCSTRHLSPGRVDVPPWRANIGGVLHFAPCGADQGLNHPDPTEDPSGFVTPVFERMRASNSVRFPARWPHTKPARGSRMVAWRSGQVSVRRFKAKAVSGSDGLRSLAHPAAIGKQALGFFLLYAWRHRLRCTTLRQ